MKPSELQTQCVSQILSGIISRWKRELGTEEVLGMVRLAEVAYRKIRANALRDYFHKEGGENEAPEVS